MSLLIKAGNGHVRLGSTQFFFNFNQVRIYTFLYTGPKYIILRPHLKKLFTSLPYEHKRLSIYVSIYRSPSVLYHEHFHLKK